MKINKFTKLKNGKYKLTGDNNSLVLTSETILKYNILVTKEIKSSELKEILDYDQAIIAYEKIIIILSKKMLTDAQVKKELKKMGVSDNYIVKIITKLKENNYLNINNYLDAYLNDVILLKMDGPRKIETDLLKLGLEDKLIQAKIMSIDNEVWNNKIRKIIMKKLKANHTKSGLELKVSIASSIVHLGYSKELVMPIIDEYDYDNEDIIKKYYEKQKKLLSRKYSGLELENKLKYKLLSKGYQIKKEDI